MSAVGTDRLLFATHTSGRINPKPVVSVPALRAKIGRQLEIFRVQSARQAFGETPIHSCAWASTPGSKVLTSGWANTLIAPMSQRCQSSARTIRTKAMCCSNAGMQSQPSKPVAPSKRHKGLPYSSDCQLASRPARNHPSEFLPATVTFNMCSDSCSTLIMMDIALKMPTMSDSSCGL